MNTVIDTLYQQIKTDSFIDWFATYSDKRYNVYSSIDIRYSGYKIAPVDVNAFPAGFNNLDQSSIERAAEVLAKSYQNKKFLIFPEDHDRNLYYNDNLLALKKIIESSGNQAVIACQNKIFSTDNSIIPTMPVTREHDLLITADNYVADIILINNDMISGFPEILSDLKQEIIPNPSLGWYQRRKSSYFNIYGEIVEKFCKDFDLDAWTVNTFISRCKQINFQKKEGLECIALAVEKMLKKITEKYREYDIKDQPYIFVKADNGSYGMGIMTVSNADEALNFNKDTRKKMNVTKGKSLVTDVLLQEGVQTIDRWADHAAEPLIYCILDQPVSFLYRYHEEQCTLENLNKNGAKFVQMKEDNKYMKVLSMISQLSLLAGAIELEHAQ